MPIYCQSLSQYLEILCAWLGTAVPVPQDWVGLQSQSQASPSKPQELQSQSRPGPSDPARTAVPVPPPRGQTGRQSQSRTGTVCVLGGCDGNGIGGDDARRRASAVLVRSLARTS